MGALPKLHPSELQLVATKQVGNGYVLQIPSKLLDPRLVQQWPPGIDPNLNKGAPTILGVAAFEPGGGGAPGVGFSGTSAVGAAGYTVWLRGSNFGDAQGTGYVRLSDNGNNWGGPGDPSSLQILQWRADFISFAVPSGTNDLTLLQPNSTATIIVVNSVGSPSAPVHLDIETSPVITSLNPSKAGPGDTIEITGRYFGVHNDTRVRFSNNNYIWGANMPGSPGGIYVPRFKPPLQIVSWGDSQIVFVVPTDKPGGEAILPGSAAIVEVSNIIGGSNPMSLALTTGVRWPVSADSGVTTIGGTGDGHMQTMVTIYEDGTLSGTTQTWDTSGWGFMTGFHGAVVVRLYDLYGNPLPPDFTAGPYGVEGGQSRQDNWSATLTQNQRDLLYSIAICNFYDPQWSAAGTILDWVANHKDEIAAVAAVVTTVAELAA